MEKILFERIKFLENEIKLRDNLLDKLQQSCKIPKNKKEEILNLILKKEKIEDFFFENGFLSFNAFLKLVEKLKNGYLVIIDYKKKDEYKTKYILTFLSKKFSSYFTRNNDYIYGIIYPDEINEIKSLNKLHYFNPLNDEFDEIELFRALFVSSKFNGYKIYQAKEKFKEFRMRPSYKDKSYIEYSLDKQEIIDFKQEKLKKEKEKYDFIYDETYPNLEIKLKRNIKNIPFVLAILERIDKEVNKIKNSRGRINVVIRMLNYIELFSTEEMLKETAKYLKDKLKEDYEI
jgi:hypothetical protein